MSSGADRISVGYRASVKPGNNSSDDDRHEGRDGGDPDEREPELRLPEDPDVRNRRRRSSGGCGSSATCCSRFRRGPGMGSSWRKGRRRTAMNPVGVVQEWGRRRTKTDLGAPYGAG